jgi:hypothetical protein
LYYGKPKSGMIDCKMLSRPPRMKESGASACVLSKSITSPFSQQRVSLRRPKEDAIILIRRGYIGLPSKYVCGRRACMSTCILGDVFEHALVYCSAQYWRKAARVYFSSGLMHEKVLFVLNYSSDPLKLGPRTKKSVFLHFDFGEPQLYTRESFKRY